MAHNDDSADLYTSADNPSTRSTEFFGLVRLDLYPCVLIKSVGKVPFDPQVHKIEDRRTAIRVMIIPLAEQNFNRDVYRDYVAEFGSWPKITLASIKALGLTTRQVHEAYARVAVVPEGRTYVSQSGETKESTTFKFVAVYANEAECRTAYLSGDGNADDPSNHQPTAGAGAPPDNGVSRPAANAENGNDRARETAWRFVEAIVKQEAGDAAKVGAKIGRMPLIAQYFTIDSPEVIELCVKIQSENLDK